MAEYEILEWDSGFFGFKVAKLLDTNDELEKTLSDLKNLDVKLVYCYSKNVVNQSMLALYGGKLINKKVLYQKKILGSIIKVSFPNIVTSYNREMSTEQLMALAIEAGEFSRFNLDAKITQEKFYEMYRTWMKKSLNNDIAKEVLLIEENQKVIAMITLDCYGENGHIGLISVAPDNRGKGLARQLMNAAQCWFVNNDCKNVFVVTQENNIPACQLYERAGYYVASIEFVYHFWL